MLLGHDDDLAGEATRTSYRIRGLLTELHAPAGLDVLYATIRSGTFDEVRPARSG
jgi:hypothetical protein